MSDTPYRYESHPATDGSGELFTTFEYHGPGLPKYANGVRFDNQGASPGYQADRVLGFIQAAYEAGKRARSEEIRKILGA